MKINQENFLRKKKRLILFLCMSLFFFSPIELFGQKVCFNYKGSWSDWKKISSGNVYHYNDNSGCNLKDGGITFFDFYITNYTPPTKSERKDHLKTDTWYEYTGVVTYYVSDTYPTAEALAKNNTLVIPNPRTDVTPKVKRTANARIKIAPYKERPDVYNIWFDDIGIGFSISGIHFNGEKKHKNKGRVATNICLTVVIFPIGWVSWLLNPVYD